MSARDIIMISCRAPNQVPATLVSNYAQNEQNFNAVERILYYTELPSEGNTTTPKDPPPSWPEGGAIKFRDVEMSYRPGLPAVLKGVSFQINPGEKACPLSATFAVATFVNFTST